MKKPLLTLIAAMIGINSIYADSVSSSFTTNEIRLVLTNSVVIDSVQLSGTSAGSFSLLMYDNNSAVTNYVTSAYTNLTSYTTNVVTTLVGVNGITNTFTNTVLWMALNTVAANTNALPTMGNWTIGTSESMFIPGPFVMTKGVVLRNVSSLSGGTNVQGGAYVINYRRQ